MPIPMAIHMLLTSSRKKAFQVIFVKNAASFTLTVIRAAVAQTESLPRTSALTLQRPRGKVGDAHMIGILPDSAVVVLGTWPDTTTYVNFPLKTL